MEDIICSTSKTPNQNGCMNGALSPCTIEGAVVAASARNALDNSDAAAGMVGGAQLRGWGG